MDMKEFIKKLEAGEIKFPEEEYMEKEDIAYYYTRKDGRMYRLYDDKMFRVASDVVEHIRHWASAKLTKEEAWEMARKEAAYDERLGEKEEMLQTLRRLDKEHRGEET